MTLPRDQLHNYFAATFLTNPTAHTTSVFLQADKALQGTSILPLLDRRLVFGVRLLVDEVLRGLWPRIPLVLRLGRLSLFEVRSQRLRGSCVRRLPLATNQPKTGDPAYGEFSYQRAGENQRGHQDSPVSLAEISSGFLCNR